MKRCVLFGVMIALLVAQAALAQTFSVKGVLREPSGRTVEDGAYRLTLRLYTQAEGGTEFWSEVHGSVQAQHGVVSVELGSVESLATVGFGETYWLGIQVEDHAEMEPRIKLGTNPYSLAVKGKDHVFPSTGNVGINTLAPTQNLEVNGNVKITDALIFGDGSSMSSADLGGTASSLLNPSTALITADSDGDGGGEIQFLTGTSTDVVIANNGNVGIGTSTPANKLSVAGNADITGNVGIGTALPGEKLTIAGSGAAIELGAGVADKEPAAGKIAFRRFSDGLDIVGAGPDQERRIQLWAEQGTHLTGGLTVANGAGITGNTNITGTLAVTNGAGITGNTSIIGDAGITGNATINGATRLGNTNIGATILSVAPGVTYFDKPNVVGGAMTIDGNNGNVGIGTATPGVKLHVVGDAAIAGSASITGNAAITGSATIAGGAGITGNTVILGNVGIGTLTPSTPLEVAGGVSLNLIDFQFFTKPSPGGPSTGLYTAYNPNPVAIRAQGGAVAANEFWAFSDRRIKNVLGASDGAQDLATLKDLEVVDYSYIDVVGKGSKTHKKLIAQQVRDVYPRAVNKGADFVPSVYQMSTATEFANGLLTITTEKEHGFAAADTVRLVFDEGYQERVVQQVVDAHTFAIEHGEAAEQVFIYGEKVHDFLSVDYEAVAMLNVSATQELARRVEALERKNAALQAELSHYQVLKAENAMLKVRMERFEAVLQRWEAQQVDQQRVEDAVVEGSGLSLAD